MSAARSSSQRHRGRIDAEPTADMSRLRARRRESRRRRRLARVDLGLGVLAGLVLLLATSGVAMAGIYGLLIVALCMLSVFVERRRRRRARKSPPRRATGQATALHAAGSPSGAPEPVTPDRRRTPR